MFPREYHPPRKHLYSQTSWSLTYTGAAAKVEEKVVRLLRLNGQRQGVIVGRGNLRLVGADAVSVRRHSNLDLTGKGKRPSLGDTQGQVFRMLEMPIYRVCEAFLLYIIHNTFGVTERDIAGCLDTGQSFKLGFALFVYLETVSHCVDQAGLQLKCIIILSSAWGYRCVPRRRT